MEQSNILTYCAGLWIMKQLGLIERGGPVHAWAIYRGDRRDLKKYPASRWVQFQGKDRSAKPAVSGT
jgi:hypothetical protein